MDQTITPVISLHHQRSLVLILLAPPLIIYRIDRQDRRIVAVLFYVRRKNEGNLWQYS
ncbi:hypothetical protein SAMN05660330_02197 [Desulforhopalus singaporensis]|uniref:Uncharacterized protein n=1 Tax=Desulforhopalus singaporensis TaxID=91360 RepID=A0A1H0R6V6_9BACT|nr:hypothetical protein SAMN05660330_02197 [Desulforhopalus singaporensis]